MGWALVRLGHPELVAVCSPYVKSPAARDWKRVRLENEPEIAALLRDTQPNIVIHCGGICDVDKCESQPEFAHQLNVKSVDILLRCLPVSTRLVYYSSDHVFGAGGGIFDENAQVCPISEYGRTRIAAEKQILRRRPASLILRGGLCIGPSIDGKTGHWDWLRYRQKNNLPMTIIKDEIRSAVWSHHLAQRIWQLARTQQAGIRHITAACSVSRLTLATYLNNRYQIGARFHIATRAMQKAPHIGHIELGTRYSNPLAASLPSVVANTRL